jgi:hypothetical protein
MSTWKHDLFDLVSLLVVLHLGIWLVSLAMKAGA